MQQQNYNINDGFSPAPEPIETAPAKISIEPEEDQQGFRNQVLQFSKGDGLSLPTYEEFTNSPGYVPPPPYEVAASAPPAILASPHEFSLEEVKEALLEHVSQKCCYGTSAAKNADISDITPSTAFHYKLETFTERRSTDWNFVPYDGGMVDGPENGPPPQPWDIIINDVPSYFCDRVVEAEVPHTASVRPCMNCGACGRVRCRHCQFGYTRCSCINGRRGEHTCSFCHGSGRRRCLYCHGHGFVTCKACMGLCRLKFYIALTVTWTNHIDNYIDEHTDLPDKLIADAQGDTLMADENFRISPVNNFPIEVINVEASKLVDQHMRKIMMERLIRQRQTIRAVPCSEVSYKYSDEKYRFFVYGHEKKVFFFEYPQSCCWCCNSKKCTIL